MNRWLPSIAGNEHGSGDWPTSTAQLIAAMGAHGVHGEASNALPSDCGDPSHTGSVELSIDWLNGPDCSASHLAVRSTS